MMAGAKHWTNQEILKLIEAKTKGLSLQEIAQAVGRSAHSCRNKLARLDSDAVILNTDKDMKRGVRRPPQKHSMCWLCKKAGKCDKPVEGWKVREKKVVVSYTNHRVPQVLIIVEKCPEFIEEEFVKKLNPAERRHYHCNEEGL